MKYADTGIDGGRIFARSFGADEFAKHGLNSTVAQVNFAYRHAHGTLRGLHWQMPPLGEAELVRCARGVIFAMAVDIRRESATFSKQELRRARLSDPRQTTPPGRCRSRHLRKRTPAGR